MIGKLNEIKEKIEAGPAPTVVPAPPARPVSQVAPYLRKAPPAPVVQAAPVPLNIPGDLKFFLVIGSDARPGQDMTRSRADSIHIAAVDPLVKKGTILGIPRDSYVDVPGHGKRKINAALALGGPDLLGQVVKNVTGLPVSHYAVTGFDGMTRIADELGGVDIDVPYRMYDKFSGADFQPGRRHMDGHDVLAFSRARHGVPGGDLGRSENQGRVILHTLEKLRKEVKKSDGIMTWLKILYKHAQLNMSIGDAFELGKLALSDSPGESRQRCRVREFPDRRRPERDRSERRGSGAVPRCRRRCDRRRRREAGPTATTTQTEADTHTQTGLGRSRRRPPRAVAAPNGRDSVCR